MNQCPEFEPELEAFRPYLVVLSRGQIPRILQRRLDVSDIVQETLLEAHQKRDSFKGNNEQSFAHWLRRILHGNLMDAIRAQLRQSRDVAKEQHFCGSLEESAIRLEEWVVADETSPSVRFDRQQRAVRLAAAIESLPEAQRDAIVMRYSQSLRISDIATEMNKSTVAVAGLLKRATAKLRDILNAEVESSEYQPKSIDPPVVNEASTLHRTPGVTK